MSKKGDTKNPPIADRFPKGTSGNPKGRPRKEKPEAIGSSLDILINKTLILTRNGVTREATVEEALQHKIYSDAIAGKRSAENEVMKMITKRDAARAKRHKPKKASALRLLMEPVDPQDVNATLLILGIAGYDNTWDLCGPDGRLVLETWAAQSAISRRRGRSRLTEETISMIKALTRDAESLRWPRGTPE